MVVKTMSYYDMNLQNIQQNRKLLYQGIIEYNKDNAVTLLEDIYSCSTKDADQAVIVKKHENEYRLNSIYSPVREAQRWIEQYKLDIVDNVIALYGLGNGCFAKEIINKMDESNHLVIYEPSIEIFMHVISHYDLEEIINHKNVTIVIENMNDFELHSTLRSLLRITNLQTQINCIHPCYGELFPEGELKFWKVIKEACVFARININTSLRFGERIITNIVHNLSYLKDSYTIYDLKEKLPSDIPAIIVSAGPSVEKSISDLKKAKGKAIIFAVDRILDYLLDNDIVPDFVTTVDPMKPIKYFSNREEISIPLICFMESNYEIMDMHMGDKIIANSSKYLADVYTELGKICPRLLSSPSVATVTCTACVEMGFKTIVFVGQDLAYNGSVTHAGGVEEEPRGDNELYVDGINGKKIKTRYDWKEFITWFEDLIFLHPDIKFIDTKTEGALIKGTELIELDRVINTYCLNEVGEFIINIPPTFTEEEIKNIKNELENDLDKLDQINKKSQEAILMCNKMKEQIIKHKVNDSFIKDKSKKLKKINDYILKQSIYWLIDDYISSNNIEILGDVYIFTDNINDDRLKTYDKSISIFNSIIEAVKFIEPKLKAGIQKLN